MSRTQETLLFLRPQDLGLGICLCAQTGCDSGAISRPVNAALKPNELPFQWSEDHSENYGKSPNFNHFVYLKSARRLVFADLQGNNDWMDIFDKLIMHGRASHERRAVGALRPPIQHD